MYIFSYKQKKQQQRWIGLQPTAGWAAVPSAAVVAAASAVTDRSVRR
jgi:hypothetical protein